MSKGFIAIPLIAASVAILLFTERPQAQSQFPTVAATVSSNRFYLFQATVESLGDRTVVESKILFRIDTWTGDVFELTPSQKKTPSYWLRIYDPDRIPDDVKKMAELKERMERK